MEDTEGRIEVDLTDVELKADDLIGMHIEPGSYLCLRVADNGRGIDKDVINKIFDPYFTTKDKSKGTGLGLSVVHGIVENYGGDVKVYSEPGKGTEFNVYLPVTGNNSVLPEIELCDILPGNNERVLLVDDQPEVLEIEQHMLDRLGYQVTVRSSSLEAMELFHAKPDEFDVVITDMTMPNMTGDKLAGKITKIRSDIPVILCTGFSERMSQGNALSSGFSEFIMKPVALEKLSKTLRKVLNKA
jgi:CheY-like chemotaxis protein